MTAVTLRLAPNRRHEALSCFLLSHVLLLQSSVCFHTDCQTRHKREKNVTETVWSSEVVLPPWPAGGNTGRQSHRRRKRCDRQTDYNSVCLFQLFVFVHWSCETLLHSKPNTRSWKLHATWWGRVSLMTSLSLPGEAGTSGITTLTPTLWLPLTHLDFRTGEVRYYQSPDIIGPWRKYKLISDNIGIRKKYSKNMTFKKVLLNFVIIPILGISWYYHIVLFLPCLRRIKPHQSVIAGDACDSAVV